MERSFLMRWIVVCASLMFSACATIGPPLPPTLDLPKPPLDLRASRKGDRVNLTWTVPTMTTDRQTIRELGPTQICRALTELKECGTPVGKTAEQIIPKLVSTKQKPQTSYADLLPDALHAESPDAFANYAVEVLNRSGRGAGLSNQVRVSLLPTLPPPTDFQAQVTNQGIVLHWHAFMEPVSQAGPHYVYRVYRSALGTSERALVGELPLTQEQNYSLTDTTFEWEKTYNYHGETVTVMEEPNHPTILVEGDDTPEVRVFADDVFPPAVPGGLQAVFSGPGQKPFIDLIWAPVTDPDLAGYNVYRHEDGTSPVKLNSELVHTPAYRDATVESGKHYIYTVSSVDQRSNESAQSEEASESVP